MTEVYNIGDKRKRVLTTTLAVEVTHVHEGPIPDKNEQQICDWLLDLVRCEMGLGPDHDRIIWISVNAIDDWSCYGKGRGIAIKRCDEHSDEIADKNQIDTFIEDAGA